MQARWTLVAWLTVSLLGATSPARAATAEPVLLIEGRHIAGADRVAVDANGRWLATASGDKTLVWDLLNGQLLQTLRPPLGAGWGGMLYAVAMSPDGQWIAAGGRSSPSGTSESIYVFRRDEGALVTVLHGLSNVVFDLAWSPDGRYLAATLGNGLVSVYRVDNFTLIDSDADCKNESIGSDFDRNGRLVTTCFDGRIRLYAVGTDGLKLVRPAAETPGGKQPYSARFSPDGSRIAVGYADAPRVDVFRADTLAIDFSPDTTGANNFLSSVAWSRDGGALFAAGRWTIASDFRIRRWSDGGRGAYKDFSAAQNTIQDLRGLPDGGVVFASGDPAWGVIDPTGQRTRVATPPIADFRGQAAGMAGVPLRVAPDGSRVAFGFEKGGKSPARFDLQARSLTLGEAPRDLLAARVDGLKVENWRDSLSPSLDGKPLALQPPFEPFRSLAIDSRGQRFVLGAKWALRLYDRTGKELWGVPVPGVAWAVSITGDDKLVIAALDDGTIRWYRIDDGRELLAFFPHADRKRWVLWTPSGYYEASVGGEDLIGWHVKRGQWAADFFPASRFRERFYRPDVIDRIRQTRDEGEAVRQANAAAPRRPKQARVDQILPPSIEMLSPREGERFSAPQLSVRVRLRAPADAPVTALKVRINARPVELGAQGSVVGEAPAGAEIERALDLNLPPEDVLVQVFAENRNGVSTPAQAKLVWAGATTDAARGAEPLPSGDSAVKLKPKLYVLAVGVSAYDQPELKLKFAAKDARDFAALFTRQQGGLYREVEVKLLTDGEVTRDSVVDGLEWLQRQVTSKDVGIVFLAGHGINSSDGLYYFAPANFDLDKVKRTGVVFSEIQNTVSALAGKALFFVDTCHSGAVLGRRAAAPDLTRVLNELSSAENGVVVFSSSTGRESSLENKSWGNGAFTAALLEGLAGKADTSGSGRVTHKMLDYYISERVKILTNGAQHPVTQAPRGVPDFPIAVVR